MKNHKNKIYIVEDDKFYANLVKEHFMNAGHEDVEVFHTGDECLMNLHKNPDVIILDHNLDDADGISVLREIKSVNPNIPVVFLSAQEEMKVAVDALKYGAFDYIEKNANALIRLTFMTRHILRVSEMVSKKKRFNFWNRYKLL